ncbi:hypothetical protein PILCRDRAFT_10290 [Piloderma croceum F 1598]|uniref:Uncharacterized protein n=1 Tax=Piloderma croceum (strain F 1598) TaxID=765440 RepID=A0A0C3F3W1_PILCF|nr:hypothetical protein PILCRDRAFT_10290 [Piloderma croceum F 1598]
MPFDHAIDPKGTLMSMIADGYFHSEDNKVLYYRLVPSSGNSQQLRFEPMDPVRFRVGDIVEVQATITAIPVKGNKFKTIAQLRSLALIDGSFTEKAAMRRAKASIQPVGWKPAIKRKVGYEMTDDDSDVTEARRGIVNMNMNERMSD